jgi:endonuclease-8
MPEGDSIARAAAKLSPLVGATIVEVDGVPDVRRWRPKLVGREVNAIRTHGKHLVIDVDGDVSIHVWLGMPGRWRIDRRDGAGRSEIEGEPERRAFDRGAIRLQLVTESHRATCYSAPTVEVERTRVIDHSLRRLGPDILDDAFDFEAFHVRTELLPASTSVADMLLDQRVVSGIGNEYKNEVLFLEGVHPATTLGALTVEHLDALMVRAARIMKPNARRRGERNTTGLAHAGSWVYDRAGKPCRRCRSPIMSAGVGDRFERITYWCPECQPVR